MSGWAIILALVMIGGGLYNLFFRDQVWQGQVWANEMRGLVSERTEGWDQWRATVGVIAVIVGALILVLGFVGRTPPLPVGQYMCMATSEVNVFKTDPGVSLKVDEGGKGSFDNQALTWTYAGGTITFSGDAGIRSAHFDNPKKPTFLFAIYANGENHTCIKHS